MSDNSDYKKTRMKLDELLPSVYRSEFNKSLFENTFNRFFTKPETYPVAGYVGKGTPKAITSRQIPENDIHRQAFQLQPILHAKNGTVDQMMSWKDALNKLEQQGVDVSKLAEWGSIQEFNFAPPIDFDKIINYRNYFWLDTENSNSVPQYVTIRNKCSVVIANLKNWENVISTYSETITITNIVSSTSTTVFDTFVINGNYSSLFGAGFPLYISNSTNTTINEQQFTVVESYHLLDKTIIRVNETFLDNTVSGNIDFTKRLNELQAEYDCTCGGAKGWDTHPWDDNPSDPVWDGELQTLLTAITDIQNLSVGLWYETSTDILYQLNITNDWIVVYTNFSTILAQTDGQALWDATPLCGINSAVKSADPWINQNKWVHKADIDNFSIAKQAQMPIIEFDWDLELNEWTYTKHIWKYRADSTKTWLETNDEPFVCELSPVDLWEPIPSTNIVILDERYGDLTEFFKVGTTFQVYGLPKVFTVVSSFYKSSGTGEALRTQLECDDASLLQSVGGNLSTGFPTSFYIFPTHTSKGDVWRGYDKSSQWLYIGVGETVPVCHQPKNPFTVLAPNKFYNQNTEEKSGSEVTSASNQFLFNNGSLSNTDYPFINSTSIPNTARALAGFDDIKVYINDIIQQGNYTEIVNTIFVEGIQFSNSVSFQPYDVIRVVIGAEALCDLGRERVGVRTDSNDTTFDILDKPIVSLIRYRKVSQPKFNNTQYPLFDLYDIRSSTMKEAKRIFSFATDASYNVNVYIGERIVHDSITGDYTFVHDLREDGKDLSYRDYTRRVTDYWFDSKNDKLYSWDGDCWTDKIYVSGYCITPIVSSAQPPVVYNFDGMLWFNNRTLVLKEYIALTDTWDIVPSNTVSISSSDPTLTSIWKTNTSVKYTPEKVDWKNRTYTEYETERLTYVRTRINELYVEDSQQTVEEMTTTANNEWYSSQSNALSPEGQWMGDWEIPNPLYFNNQHENRTVLTLRELYTHFKSVIDSQPLVPGFSGVTASMFRLLESHQVDYSMGGTIKEYNNGFTNFLSSLFIQEPTFEQVVYFASKQYDSLLNSLNEYFKRDVVSILSDNITTSDWTQAVSTHIINLHENNSFYATIYNDSTVSTIKNWIATLPYLGINQSASPTYVKDSAINANFIVHHDSHLDGYSLPLNTVSSLCNQLVKIKDSRTNTNLGISSTLVPPKDKASFISAYGFDASIKNGALWYDTTANVLYRLFFEYVSTTTPPTSTNYGEIWLDTSSDIVYTLTESGWINFNAVTEYYTGTSPLDSISTSAWKIVNLDEIFAGVITDVENRLFTDSRTTSKTNVLDINTLKTNNISAWNKLEQDYFYQYTTDIGIRAPLVNDEYVASNAFTWNYSSAIPSIYPVSPVTISGCWQNVYKQIYGTFVPHIEPWKLQGYNSRPDWWNEEYLNTDRTQFQGRRWKQSLGFGMWSNILAGKIPPNRTYPNNVIAVTGDPNTEPSYVDAPILPVYNYVSVNVDDTDITIGSNTYKPDDLYPPYLSSNPSPTNRTVFDNISQIVRPSSNYLYGTGGTQEFLWKSSIDYLYKQLLISYRIDPIKTFNSVFGFDIITLGAVEFNADTQTPISQTDVIFHGDVINTNQQYQTNGLNQWYVDYCRYNGFDINGSHISNMWKEWAAPLTYQMSTFVETASTEVSHRHVDLSTLDYKFLTKKSPNVDQFWLHTFDVSILEFPPSYSKYGTQSDWKFEVASPANSSSDIVVYGVHRYQFFTDVATNVCHAFTYPISAVGDEFFVISGDYEEVFKKSSSVLIMNSVNNDNLYTIANAVYDDTAKLTTIYVNESVDNSDNTGQIKAVDYRNIPWSTGDIIDLVTDGAVPHPLYDNKQYFIIVIDGTTFQLARTQSDAVTNQPIVLTDSGVKNSYIGRKSGSFTILDMANNNDTWYTFECDKTHTRTISLPYGVFGIQNLIDFVIGYDVFSHDQGWRINVGQVYRDEASNRAINWQFALETFIDFAYMEKTARTYQNMQSYAVTYNDLDSVFEFESYASKHITGDAIVFASSGGPLPNGVSSYVTYYMIRLTDTTFNIATTARDAKSGLALTGISSAVGQGVVTISTPNKKRATIPHAYINPIQNGVWFTTAKGIVTDLTANIDNFGRHTLFAQTGMAVKPKNIFVYRQDNLTNIHVSIENQNDYLAVTHVPIDYYEHVIQFNNKTTGDDFIYDPFIGLNITKIELSFERQIGDKQRPTIGGFVLTKDAQGNKNLTRNIEGNIDDLRYAYDHTLNRRNEFVEQSQKTLGYVKESTSLDSLYISPKSQFEFWKGMIQHKGSINSVKAFVNSKRFIDAKVDDFWAVKIATYGSNLEKEYMDMFLTVNDSLGSNVKFEFNNVPSVDTDFVTVSLTNGARWYNQPDQIKTFSDNGSEMYFVMKPYKTYITTIPSNGVIKHNLNTNCVVCTTPNSIPNNPDVEIPSGSISIINNQILHITGYVEQTVTVWGFVVDAESQSPFNIVDIKSHTKVSNMIFWNPALDLHYGVPLSNIDVTSSVDPADYTNTVVNETVVEDDGITEVTETWNSKQVGTTWWDTGLVGYVPYSDSYVYPTLDQRLSVWGKQAEYSKIRVLEWVRSDVAPSEWDQLASIEVGNTNIDETVRKSGNVFKTLFRKNNMSQWYVMKPSVQYYDITTSSGTVLDLTIIEDFTTDDTLNVYVNGAFISNIPYATSVDIATLYPNIQAVDYITCVRPVPSDETEIDNLVNTGNYKHEYQYTSVQTLDDFNNVVTTYYFWVENKITRTKHSISAKQIAEELTVCSVPYVVFDSFLSSTSELPTRCNRFVVCGMQGLIRDNNRYVMRFTRDFTLRDSIAKDDSVKTTVHEEWKMFRKEQLFNIDRWMWDKITEAMIGYKLTSPSTRVPAYDRELYDLQYSSDTQYGLEDGQAFTNGLTAKETIMAYLEDPSIDFYPMDIGVFLEENNLDTPESTIVFMDNLYNSFPYMHVNRIFFSVLLDALSFKRKYPGLMKTSMIALHGVKPFLVNGIFDDD